MIYIYLKQSATLPCQSTVCLSDVAQVCRLGGPKDAIVGKQLGKLKKDAFLITATDVIAALGREDVTMLGAPACVVLPAPVADKPFKHWTKAVLVAILLFVGGGMTVLSYQTDTAMLDAHKALSVMVTGTEDNAAYVALPYCIGVGAGALLFSNVLPGKKKSPSLFELEQFEKEEEQREYLANKTEEDK